MAEETETETTEGGLRSQMWKHDAMVEWINETEGVTLDEMTAGEIIAYAFAKRVAWRNSDTYQDLVTSHKAEAAEAAEARKAEREAAAEKRKAEKAAAKAAADAEAEKAEKTTAKATKTPAKATAAKATKTPAKATKTARKTTKATGTEEDPFS